MLADYLSKVGRVNAKLENGDLFPFDRPDLNLIRIIHKRLGDGFNELLHVALPCDRVIRNIHEERVCQRTYD